jgi:hypothetical protein
MDKVHVPSTRLSPIVHPHGAMQFIEEHYRKPMDSATILSHTSQLLNVILQLVIIAAPLVLSWAVRTYLGSSSAARRFALIAQLSGMAINFVENLDRRGDLTLPPDVQKGAYKLQIASNWLSHELERQGIVLSSKQAQSWVAAEFQKQVGDVRPVARIDEQTRLVVRMVRQIQDSERIQLPPGLDRISYAAELAADAIMVNLAQHGVSTTRETALSWARAELVRQLHAQIPAQDRARVVEPTDPASVAKDVRSDGAEDAA